MPAVSKALVIGVGIVGPILACALASLDFRRP